jgi:Fe-S-cluster containining protein
MSNELLNTVLRRLEIQVPLAFPAVDCVGCTQALLQPAAAQRWQTLKCCTFQPFVANYACGAAEIAQVDPRKAVLQPLGVMATHAYKREFRATPEAQMSERQACTFYDLRTRRCGIWAQRPGECSLHFCSTDAQAGRREEWKRKIFTLESALAQLALAHLGFGPRELSEQLGYLNEPPEDLPSLSKKEAREIYHFSWQWIEQQEPQALLEMVDFDNLAVNE